MQKFFDLVVIGYAAERALLLVNDEVDQLPILCISGI